MREKGRKNSPMSRGVGGQVGGKEGKPGHMRESAGGEAVCWQAQNLTTVGLLFPHQSQLAAAGRRSGRGL